MLLDYGVGAQSGQESPQRIEAARFHVDVSSARRSRCLEVCGIARTVDDAN